MRTRFFAAALLAGLLMAAAGPALALDKKEFTYLCRSGAAQELREALARDQGFINVRLDGDGETPLMRAAEKTWSGEVIRILLEAGASVNDRDEDGETPLMYAMDDHATLEVVKALLAGGASVDQKDRKGRTALMHALKEHADTEVVSALLDAGANVKERDNKGRSVLDYARYKGRLQGTDVLRRIEDASR